jgi:hypothetical protein
VFLDDYFLKMQSLGLALSLWRFGRTADCERLILALAHHVLRVPVTLPVEDAKKKHVT